MIKKILIFLKSNSWIKPFIFSIIIFSFLALISQEKTIPFVYSIFD